MPQLIEVKIDSLRVSLTNQQRIVVLKQLDADRFLPIWIGPYEAEAITIALQEIEVSAPDTRSVEYPDRNHGRTPDESHHQCPQG
jgi:bifunctional DNase/RNase